MSATARSLLLVGMFFALVGSQFAVMHALGHEIAFMVDPNSVPAPGLLDHPLVRMVLVAVAFAAFLEVLVAESLPREGWTRPFDPAYRGQHFGYLLTVTMALIVVSFVFVVVRGSHVLEQWFWWTVIGINFLLALATVWACVHWLKNGSMTIAAE